MNKKALATIITITIILGFAGLIIAGSNSSEPSALTYYYGVTCPYCKEVEKYIEKNKLDTLLPLEKREVYENRKNQLELQRAARKCGLDIRSAGVPFLVSEGKCIEGYENIIAELDKLAKISKNEKE